jgi:hypothetical protein
VDKEDMNILINVHKPPAEGNFCDEQGTAYKPAITENYGWHVGYIEKGHKMADSYSICGRTWKWTKKLFFHLLDRTI